MTVRSMNAKALGHVGFFIRGIQFRALGRVKTQKVAATELNPSRHVRGRRAFNAALLHPNHPSSSCFARAIAFSSSFGRCEPIISREPPSISTRTPSSSLNVVCPKQYEHREVIRRRLLLLVEIGHSPFQTGLRFSMNACTPSRKSRLM